jgi:hypothetical protein
VPEDGSEVFEVVVQPVQEVQHENTVSDIDVEVSEGVSEALHLSTVDVDAKLTQNEAPEGGVNVEGAGFVVAMEVVLQGQPGVTSRVAALPSDILQVKGDGVMDP